MICACAPEISYITAEQPHSRLLSLIKSVPAVHLFIPSANMQYKLLSVAIFWHMFQILELELIVQYGQLIYSMKQSALLWQYEKKSRLVLLIRLGLGNTAHLPHIYVVYCMLL